MDTASNSLTKPENNGILNNKTKTTTNQLKKNLNQSEESISLTSKASVNNFEEHYPSTTQNQDSTKPPHFASQVKVKSNNLFSQTQEYKVNDTTYVQYEKNIQSIHKFTFYFIIRLLK